MKKIYLIIFLLTFVTNVFALQINGVVKSTTCKTDKVMIWLALDKADFKHKTVLMHTMVPIGGDFSFYVKPG